ncbi:hypothetical protein COV20_03860 [Candidatus Woesearchaeota archaeon CG10_big_fil_rev_8_21_14_0_10_45_16]|nr:MAG: hypothetical protein COV20_03860 [Candidatus Woesearchaeota archaeon CG10_big_fil_rev_8_21_14_0_10_45_16]
MKIALLAPGYLISKKEATWKTLKDLAKEYNSAGHKAVICARKHPSLPVYEKVEDVDVWRLYSGKMGITQGRKTLAHLKKKGLEFDVVHGFGSHTLSILGTYLAARWTGQKNRSRIIHTIKSEGGRRRTSLLCSPLLNLADKVTFPTNVLMKKHQRFGCRKSKCRVIRSNINLEHCYPRDKASLRQKHGFDSRPIVLYCGALRKEKGVDDLIKAIPSVIKDFPEALFIFAIRSKAYSKEKIYLEKARSLGCQQSVRFTFEDIPIGEYISLADTLVLAYPTLLGTEGNPSSLLEAMAAKVPVVTTKLPELQEIAVDGVDLLMAEPGNPVDVGKKVIKMLRDPMLREKLGENAYKKALRFDVKEISRQMLDIYQQDEDKKINDE